MTIKKKRKIPLSSSIYIFLELKNYRKDLIFKLLQLYEGFKTLVELF